MKNEKPTIHLIGGRLDGACAVADLDENEVTLHEEDTTSGLRTGKHYVYERKDEHRFTFKRAFIDGGIVELANGPMKGAKISVKHDDGCILMRSVDGSIVAYTMQDGHWKFSQSFKTAKDAEEFAKGMQQGKEKHP